MPKKSKLMQYIREIVAWQSYPYFYTYKEIQEELKKLGIIVSPSAIYYFVKNHSKPKKYCSIHPDHFQSPIHLDKPIPSKISAQEKTPESHAEIPKEPLFTPMTMDEITGGIRRSKPRNLP